MVDSQDNKIDRSQRIHGNGLVVRVYQIFGTVQYGWDTNHEQRAPWRPLHESRAAAEEDADDALRRDGHACGDACDSWQPLI